MAQSFGQNGAVLDEMNDDRLALELRDRKLFHAWYSASLFALLSLGFVANHYLRLVPTESGFGILVFSLLAAGTVAPVMVANAQNAIEQFRLPRAFGKRPQHEHVSGGAVLLIALALTFVVTMLRIVDGVEGELVMRGSVGLFVVCAIAAAFIVFILSPRLISSGMVVTTGRFFASLTTRKSPIGGPLNLMGRAVSVFDSWLVYIVAPAAGANLKRGRDRYGVLSIYLVMSGLLVWYFPAPFGLLPAFVWFMIAISVGRRWAWIEDDRELTLRRPKYDSSELRVGVEEDLRDEALLALLSLIVLLPLAMRQIHYGMGGVVFTASEGFSDTIWTWISFFGLELAKAVPFVDWADIYNVQTDYVLRSDAMVAHHVVFAARAVVDLVFLSALLQAISISLKLSRHKRMFFNKEINLLDPMIEKIEFEKLAYKVGKDWKVRDEVERFLHYDPVGLARIRARNPRTSAMYFVATEIKERQLQGLSTAAEELLEAVCAKVPMFKDVKVAWDEAKRKGDLPLEILAIARTSLNAKPPFNELRTEIADEIARKHVSVERNKALRSLIVGEDQDTIYPIRLKAIGPLVQSANWDVWNLRALKSAAQSDRSRAIRRAAARALKDLGPTTPSFNAPPRTPPDRPDGPTAGVRTIPVLGTID